MFYSKFYIFKYLIAIMDFTATKSSGQGSFTVKKGAIDKLLFLLKTIESANGPLGYGPDKLCQNDDHRVIFTL